MFITDLFPVKEDEKYTPKTLLNFVKNWERLGHQVTVVKPDFLPNSFLRGKPYYKEGLYGNIIKLNYFTPFFSKRKLEKYCDISEYDIVIAHMPVGILFANSLGVDYIAGVHISDLEILTNPLYSFYFRNKLKNAYKKAKAIACRSYVLKNKFLNVFPELENKTFVAPSGVDKSIIIKRQVNSEPTRIITCSQLIRRKNIDKLILAVDKFPNARLIVIGDGKEKNRLQKLAKTNVVFKGWCSHNKVLEYMRNSDIFILPSAKETFGMVYLEAMASGCITCGIKNEGIDGIIKNNENGFLLENANVDEIIKFLDFVFNCKQLQSINDNAYNTIVDYADEICAENYLKKILQFI